MRTYLECYPCVLNQALEAAKFAQLDESDQRTILHQAMTLLQQMSPGVSPPVIGQYIHRMVRNFSGERDPYAGAKQQANQEALALLPSLRNALRTASDPLEIAVRYAIAGNIIDFGAQNDSMDIQQEITQADKAPFGRCHLEQFRDAVSLAGSILYIGDNAGEIVFDRLLVELLLQISDADITFAVRGSPILNDATIEDAQQVGLDDLVPVISNGSDAPGTIVTEVNDTVREHLTGADLIIAKGQGNYETLSHHAYPLFFLLKVKCPVIGRDMGVSVGQYVLAGNPTPDHKRSAASAG
ncbi:MAG TPA: ARMT1-like domain-containing protein [bacterium]|nr:ARMT1-like domain-containing protein [bacterium]